MAFILMLARKGRMEAWHGRQIRRRGRDGLDPRLLVIGDDCDRLLRFLRRYLRPGGVFEHLDLAINTQDLGHLLLELGVATFQVVAHLVRLDFLLAENFAHRALDQMGETFMSGLSSVLARMAGQQPRRPQLVRIAMFLGLVARQRHQPGLGVRRNHRLFSRWTPSLCPTAKNDGFSRYASSIAARDTRLAGSLRDRERAVNVSISSSVIANSTACRHVAMIPILVQTKLKRGIHKHASSSADAGFTESVV